MALFCPEWARAGASLCLVPRHAFINNYYAMIDVFPEEILRFGFFSFSSWPFPGINAFFFFLILFLILFFINVGFFFWKH